MLASHRKSPNRLRELRQRVHALVSLRLGNRVICTRCGATNSTFAEKCIADFPDACPGFNVIERVRADAKKEVGLT
jgi:hypothetical protein